MRLLIIGINGFLGRAIAGFALAEGITVFGLSRSKRPETDQRVHYLQADRRDPSRLDFLLAEHGIDTVVDVIAYTRESTAPVLEVLDRHITQYVLLSSCDVYRNYGLLIRKESGDALERLMEESPLREKLYPYRQDRPADDPEAWRNDYDKIPIEEDVSTMDSNWTILRLPMVFGPGDRQHRFNWAIQPMKDGVATLEIPQGWANWVSTYSYVDDVAMAVVLSLGNASAYKRIFNVGEESPVDHVTWAKRIADEMNWQGEIRTGEFPEHPLSRSTADLDLSVNLLVDSTAIRNTLGYKENNSISEDLSSTIVSE